MIKIRNLIRFFSLCLASVLCGGESGAQPIEAALNAYTDVYQAERLHIHYDKPVYSPGETVWFKAYLMADIIPADASKTLYIDWIDDKGGLMHHGVSPLLDAVTHGQFEIPANYRGRYIQVRAYTRWMLNFDSAFLYSRVIRMLLPETGTPIVSAPAVPSLGFYPEGGDALIGIGGKIAFKASDQFGRPVRIRGVVASSQGKIVDSLRVLHDGMGAFYLTPEAGVSYTARWKDEKNVEHTTVLPAAKTSGVSLQINLSGTKRFINVRSTRDLADANDSFHIVGTMYQRQTFIVSRPSNVQPIRVTLPTENLPSGVLTITVFNKQWLPVAERITFVNNGEYRFDAGFEVQHWGLGRRARNEVVVSIPDSLVANLSVSVTDASISADSSNNIYSRLFLTSELRGEINNPAYYLSGNSDEINRDADLLMLTNGWRRLKWDQVIARRIPKPAYARDSSYLTLSGKLLGVVPGQITPESGIVLVVKQKDKPGEFILEQLKQDGTFDNSTILFDTAHVYYNFQGKSQNLKGASVQFMVSRLPAPSYFPAVRSFVIPADTLGFYRQWKLANEANDQAFRLKVVELEAVTVKSRTKTPVQQLDEKYTSGLFIGDGYQFDLVNDPVAGGYQNIFNYLQGKVAGLQVNATSNPPSLVWRGGAPQLYLDEVATDPNMISTVNISDVAYIKVFRPPFFGSGNGANGAIAIYTRKGNDVKNEPGKGLNNVKVFGYSPIREFYSPNYASFVKKNEERDLRTTLYWNPAVALNPMKREIKLTFYNNDVSQAFRVVIEGMTRDGRITHVEQMME